MSAYGRSRIRRGVVFRRVTLDQVGDDVVPVVFCPRETTILRIADCRNCPRFAGLCAQAPEGDTFLRCIVDDQDTVQPFDARVPQREVWSEAERTAVSRIATAPVPTVTADASVEQAVTQLTSRRIDVMPVVDATGKVVGLVTRRDAMAALHEADESDVIDVSESDPEASSERAIRVRDIMKCAVFSLSDSASISRAALLMAYEETHYVLILDANKDVFGVVSSWDILRWVAQSACHVHSSHNN